MNTLFKRLLPAIALLGLMVPAQAQISDDEPSQSLLAIQCAASSGFPASGYADYCRRLAKTVGFLDSAQQERVFGYVPQPYAESENVNQRPYTGVGTGGNLGGLEDLGNDQQGSENPDFNGSPPTQSGSGQVDEEPTKAAEEERNDWLDGFFGWLEKLLDDQGIDTPVLDAFLEGNKKNGDGNNGHGNDPDGFDESNPGKGNKKNSSSGAEAIEL